MARLEAPQEPDKPSPDAAAAKGRRLNPIKLRQMQERCSFVEEEIPRLESSIADAEASLGVYESAEETQRLTQLLRKPARSSTPRSPPSGKSWCCNWSSRRSRLLHAGSCCHGIAQGIPRPMD